MRQTISTSRAHWFQPAIEVMATPPMTVSTTLQPRLLSTSGRFPRNIGVRDPGICEHGSADPDDVIFRSGFG